MQDHTRNAQMYAHCEGTMSLYRNINSILKNVGYSSFCYGDLLKPSLCILLIPVYSLLIVCI